MKNIIVGRNEAGQRLDKLLAKFLDNAPKSFIYKMLRKKNIKLNDKKAEGNEKLVEGDTVSIYLADDTLEQFRKEQDVKIIPNYKIDILYEDDNIVLLNKPVGMLSQKAKDSDVSAVEYLIDYLLNKGELSKADMECFRPSVCNRLDRNTSGILLAGKSLKGLQVLSELIRSRDLGKYYKCIVYGETEKQGVLKGHLLKDKQRNTVIIENDGDYIETEYRQLATDGEYSLLEVKLITGKPHQIRAHFASIGHPIIGDIKYGNREVNRIIYNHYNVKSQLLHAYKVVFPESEALPQELSGRIVTAKAPEKFRVVEKALFKQIR